MKKTTLGNIRPNIEMQEAQTCFIAASCYLALGIFGTEIIDLPSLRSAFFFMAAFFTVLALPVLKLALQHVRLEHQMLHAEMRQCTYEELEKICGVNRLIPAFPGAGGSIDNGILNASLTPKIIQPTTFGEISKRKTDRIAELAEIFRKSHIPYQIVSDMHNWQISHLGMVVPIADAYYMSSSPETVYENKAIMKKTAKQMKDNFKILAKHKILSPFKFYLFMICPTWVFTIILSAVFKSKFGHKFMYEHSMNAPQEMRQLHTEFYDFISWNIV